MESYMVNELIILSFCFMQSKGAFCLVTYVQIEGQREVKRRLQRYALPMIIAVG